MKIRTLSVVVGAVFGGQAIGMDFIDIAPVVAVTALYGPVADARDCFAPPPGTRPVMAGGVPGQMAQAGGMPPQAGAPQQPPSERSMVAPVIGGVAGALLGSQVGQGRGRDAATAVGAVAGTVAGDGIANPNRGGSMMGAIVGGGVGALLGNQVGQGSGRTAATAAGAIGGAMVGDRLMSNPPPQQPAQVGGQYPIQQAQAPIDRCRTVDGSTREILRGYSVVYRYSGRDITTTVPYHPGNSIRVAIGAVDSGPPQAAYPAGGGYPIGGNPMGGPPPGTNPQVPIGGGYIPR